MLAASAVHAQGDFDSWLAGFRQDAQTQGISAATLDAALTGRGAGRARDRARPPPARIPADLCRLPAAARHRIRRGARVRRCWPSTRRCWMRSNRNTAFRRRCWWRSGGWKPATATVQGSLNVPASLATLAWDGRRSGFFRSQLLDALRIIDAGHVSAVDMNGSWAGAMGHMQFMPSTFRAYAVDGDGDGRIDVWQSLPDAMYSAAHYLQQVGWRANEPVAIEVRLPENFDWRQARLFHRLPVADWAAMGVQAADGGRLAGGGRAGRHRAAAGLAGAGLHGVRQFRRGDEVEPLAELRAGGGAAVEPAGGRPCACSPAKAKRVRSASRDFKALQQALDELGIDAGKPDGLPGPRTQTAIRLYQALHQLPVDGYAGTEPAGPRPAVACRRGGGRQAHPGARPHLCRPGRRALRRRKPTVLFFACFIFN